MYVNGVQEGGDYTDSNNYIGTTTRIGGRFASVSGDFRSWFGYISNARVVKGTAVYTADFTPPTEPLTAITDTSLLTCQSNRFVDNSTNNFVITRNGDARIDGFDPFVPAAEFAGRGSTYFDGTGDYLNVPISAAQLGTGNFTIQLWVYPQLAGNLAIFDSRGGSTSGDGWFLHYSAAGALTFSNDGSSVISPTTSTAPLNVWTHLAICRVGSTITFYINGVPSGTATNTSNFAPSSLFYIGIKSLNTSSNVPFLGYMADIQLLPGTALYTEAFTPPAEPLTAVANTSLVTCQTNQPANNNTFLDSSTNNFLVTRFGNTTQGASSPYGGGWSNYFDGTGDELTVANNAAFNFGSGNFTVECWFNLTADATANNDGNKNAFLFGPGQIVNNEAWLMELGGNSASSGVVIAFQARNTSGTPTVLSYTANFKKNTWYHVAASRAGNTLLLFVDGVKVAENTNWTLSVNSGGSLLRIGRRAISSNYEHYFPGYISNVRVVKGTAVYTANFTPLTQPLEPIAGTSLLTCADNRFVDDSPNNFAITRNGDVSVQKFNPFGIQTAMTPQTHSAFFDGTGDHLFLAGSTSAVAYGTSDFTIELWFYALDTTWRTLWDQRNGNDALPSIQWCAVTANKVSLFINNNFQITSTNTFNVGQWHHVAVVRYSGIITLYVNGVNNGTYSYSTSISGAPSYIGNFSGGGFSFNGYISNFRVVNGTAVYTAAFTPPTAPLTAVANTSLLTCQSPTFVDNSSNRSAITAAGDARPSQTNPFGFTAGTKTSYTPAVYGGSMSFDGTGDYLNVAPTAQTYLSSEPFTMEAWAYPTANNGMIAGRRSAVAARGFLFGFDATNKIRFWAGDSDVATWNVQLNSANTYPLNQWYHIVATRNSSNVFNLWVNGTSVATATASFTIADDTSTLQIGTVDSGSSPFSGYMTDFRFVKGTAVYTSSFVPPTAPLEPIINTTLLLNGTAAAVRDASMSNNLETVGDAKLSTSVVKYGDSSIVFNGSSLAVIPYSPILHLSSDFTIECWFRANSYGGMILNFAGGLNIAWASYELVNNTDGINFAASSANNGYNIGSETGTTGRIGTITLSTWNHLAVTRSGNIYRGFVNGLQGYTQTLSLTPYNPGSRGLTVGGNYSTTWATGTVAGVNGNISDLRITKGVARYTANFTPPTAALKKK
jgi:hypothetical protein